MSDEILIAEFEQQAEMAYAAMYDMAPHGVKDCFDDARSHFAKAIDAAQQAGLSHVAARLVSRLKHVEDVYNSQFRNIGR